MVVLGTEHSHQDGERTAGCARCRVRSRPDSGSRVSVDSAIGAKVRNIVTFTFGPFVVPPFRATQKAFPLNTSLPGNGAVRRVTAAPALPHTASTRAMTLRILMIFIGASL